MKNNIGGFKRIYILLLFGFIGQLSMAQIQVNGMVRDSNIPLPGASIVEKGTTNGTQTDFDGNFTINVGENATLVFSYIGYKTREILVSGQSVINVTLDEDSQNLAEVVVIGYGTQLKENITGSVASVEVEDITSIPQVSIG